MVYIYDAYRVKEATPIQHAGVIRAKGDWIPVAWPHDGLQHDKGSGVQLAKQYKNAGLNMMANRITFEDGTERCRSRCHAFAGQDADQATVRIQSP